MCCIIIPVSHISVHLLTLAFVICLYDLVNSHKCSLQGIKTGNMTYSYTTHIVTEAGQSIIVLPRRIQHLLLDFSPIGTPAHQEQLGLECGLSAVRVELVFVVVESVSAVFALPLLLVEIFKEVSV